MLSRGEGARGRRADGWSCPDSLPNGHEPTSRQDTSLTSLTSKRRRWLLGTFAAGLYLLLACLAYWPVAPLDGSHIVGCACSDQAQEVWFLNWTAFAVLHGHNPFFTDYLMTPKGSNLGTNTAMPLLGLLGLPVTATAGAVAAYNLWLRLAFAVSGFSMYLLLRRYSTWWPAALIGGVLYGFSPYMIGQSHAHLFLTFVPIPPLVVALVDDWLVSNRRPAGRSGVLLGIAAGLQYLISPEVLAMTAIAAGVGVAALCARHRQLVRERWPSFLVGSAVALAVFGMLVGYPIWMLLAGPRHVNGPPHSVHSLAVYSDNAVGPVVPTSNQLIDPPASAQLTNPALLRDPAESGVYLGVPLLLAILALVIRFRRTGIVVAAGAAGAGSFLLSLGARLELTRHILAVRLPFALLAQLPLLQSIEPARFSLFVQLSAALVLGVGLDRLRGEGLRPVPRAPRSTDGCRRAGLRRRLIGLARRAFRPALVSGLAVLVLLPLLPRLPYHSVRTGTPGFFASPAAEVIPSGAVALTYPWSARPNDDAMFWQIASGMRFKLMGGDVFVPGEHGISVGYATPAGSTAVQHLLLQGTKYYKGPAPPDDFATRSGLCRMIETRRIAVVLVLLTTPGADEVVDVVSQVLGRAPRRFGPVDLWIVPRVASGQVGRSCNQLHKGGSV